MMQSHVFAYFAPGWLEIAIVGGIVLLLFGNRLPGAMRSLGRSFVEFKKGVKGLEDDDASADAKTDNASSEKKPESS